MFGAILGIATLAIDITKLCMDSNKNGVNAVMEISLEDLKTEVGNAAEELKGFIVDDNDKEKLNTYEAAVVTLSKRFRDWKNQPEGDENEKLTKALRILELKDEVIGLQSQLAVLALYSSVGTGLAGYPYYMFASSLLISIYQECSIIGALENANSLTVAEIESSISHCESMHKKWAEWHPLRYKNIVGKLETYEVVDQRDHSKVKYEGDKIKVVPTVMEAIYLDFKVHFKFQYEYFKNNIYTPELIDTGVSNAFVFDKVKGAVSFTNILGDPGSLRHWFLKNPVRMDYYIEAANKMKEDIKSDWHELYEKSIKPSNDLIKEWKKLRAMYTRFKKPNLNEFFEMRMQKALDPRNLNYTRKTNIFEKD